MAEAVAGVMEDAAGRCRGAGDQNGRRGEGERPRVICCFLRGVVRVCGSVWQRVARLDLSLQSVAGWWPAGQRAREGRWSVTAQEQPGRSGSDEPGGGKVADVFGKHMTDRFRFWHLRGSIESAPPDV